MLYFISYMIWRIHKRRSSQIHPVSHSRGLRSVDDVTIDRRWRHRCPAGRNICDAHTQKTISNSSDIDFIHGYMHDRSCKKMRSPYSRVIGQYSLHPKKYAHFRALWCFVKVITRCHGFILPINFRLTSLVPIHSYNCHWKWVNTNFTRNHNFISFN